MASSPKNFRRFVRAISKSGISIYDPVEVDDPKLWIPTPALEALLNTGLKGLSLGGMSIRTRSKVAKEHVCRTLGYPIPKAFKKTQPRFPGQLLDTYVQKSNNLQIWNEEIKLTRRYILIRVSPDDRITRVKVVTGEILALLDNTGTLTQKYQARLVPGEKAAELVAVDDTRNLQPLLPRKLPVIRFQKAPLILPA